MMFIRVIRVIRVIIGVNIRGFEDFWDVYMSVYVCVYIYVHVWERETYCTLVGANNFRCNLWLLHVPLHDDDDDDDAASLTPVVLVGLLEGLLGGLLGLFARVTGHMPLTHSIRDARLKQPIGFMRIIKVIIRMNINIHERDARLSGLSGLA